MNGAERPGHDGLPSFSIVMATWNGAPFLRAQVESLFRQTRAPVELIVCDDASTDGTVAMLHELAASSLFPMRIHVQPERVGYARNFACAADRAGGDIILFADQDDIWLDTKIERLGEVVARTDAALIGHDFTVFRSAAEPVLPSFFAHLADLALPRDVCIKGCSLAVRRDFLHQWGWPPPQGNVSHDFWLCFLASAVEARAFLDERLIRHRLHDANASGWIVGDADRVAAVADVLGIDPWEGIDRMLELVVKPGRAHWIPLLRTALSERATPAQAALADRAIARLHILEDWHRRCAAEPRPMPRRPLIRRLLRRLTPARR